MMISSAFPRNPGLSQPSRQLLASERLSASDDSDAFKMKQAEIRQLQEASQSLLRRAGTSASVSLASTPGGRVFETGIRLDDERFSNVEGDDLSLRGSDLLSHRSGGSGIAPLALLSSTPPELPPPQVIPLSDDDAGSWWSGNAGAVQTRAVPSASLRATPAPLSQSLDASRSQLAAAELRSLKQENAGLRQEVMELRRAALERDKELRLQTAAVRRSGEATADLKQRLAESERACSKLSDDIERLRKAGDIADLLKGDQAIHKGVRSYIENDLATMRADRREAEHALRAELQSCQEQVERLEIQLHVDDSAAQKQRAMERRFNSLETFAQEAQAATAVQAQTEAALQDRIYDLEAECQEFERGGNQETRKFQRKVTELEKQSLQETEDSAKRIKEAEHNMHRKLSDARQERNKVETKLKKQIQTLQAECRDAQTENSEAAIQVAQASVSSQECIDAVARANEAQEEVAVLTKKFAAEKSKSDGLLRKARWEEVECRQQMQIELVKEHSRAHDEAWAQLSAIEDRHGSKFQELQHAHGKKVTELTTELVDASRSAEQRADEEELRVAKRVQGIHTELLSAQKVHMTKAEEIASLNSEMAELRQEVASANEEAESAVQQRETLLAVLRKEREVADHQFQQLLVHTEEKQRAILHLQKEVDHDTRTPASQKDWSCPTSSMPPLVSSKTAEVSRAVVARCQSDGDSDETPRSLDMSAHGAGAGENGVAAMLSHLSVEREVHETRRAVEELTTLLSAGAGHATHAGNGHFGHAAHAAATPAVSPGAASVTSWAGSVIAPADASSHARELVDQVLVAYEHAMKHVSDEKHRNEAAKHREIHVKEYFHKMEMRNERKHEQTVHDLKRHNHQREQQITTEALQMEEAMQAAFEAERGESQAEHEKVLGDMTIQISELTETKKKYDVLAFAEADNLQCKVDAVHAKLDGDMREQLAVAKGKAEAEMVELRNKHQTRMSQLEAENAKYVQTLESAHADEHEGIRSELQELSRCLKTELAAARDEHSEFVKHERSLEATIDTYKRDRSETEIVVHETQENLQQELFRRDSEIHCLESSLQATERKLKSAEGEWSADRLEQEAVLEQLGLTHGEEREFLAKEIQQFQDERLLLEERFRQQEAVAEDRFQTFREEMEDVEIDLQRTEAVSAERGRLLEQNRKSRPGARSPPRQKMQTVDEGALTKTGAFDFRDGSTSPKRFRTQGQVDAEVERLQKQNDQLQVQTKVRLRAATEAEVEANAAADSLQEKCEMQLEAWAQSEKDLKGQLCQLREDKNRERQMKDRQIDKLKGRVSELTTSAESVDKKHFHEAAEHRRQSVEMSERLAKVKTEGQKLRSSLQESQSEKAAAQQGIEALQFELSKSEAMLDSSHKHCEEMLQESYVGRHTVNSCQSEVQALQGARDQGLRAVAGLEMQMEQARRTMTTFSSECQEARGTTERLCKAFGQEIINVLPMAQDPETQELAAQLRDQSSVPSEDAVIVGFKALANFVSGLARKNAELRSNQQGKRGNMTIDRQPSFNAKSEDDKIQMATLQKDVVKLKEENQEISLENNQLRSQLGDAHRSRDDAHRARDEALRRHEMLSKQDMANRQREDTQVDIAGHRQQLNEARRQRDDAHRQRDEAFRQRDLAGGDISQSQDLASGREEDSFGASDVSPGRGGPSPTSPVLEGRSAEFDDIALKGLHGRKTPSFGGLNHVEMRLKLRQLHAEKVHCETTLITYKQEVKSKQSEFREQIEELKAQLWESQHERENEADIAQKSLSKQERKVKWLEGKLQERMESEQSLTLEKEGVEEQLNLAAKQLEALLAEEGRDGDLQRDLAGLSQQFEQLHGKHRQQLAKAQEMNKALERERERRVAVEEQLHNHEMQIDRELRLAHERHMTQMNQIQDQVQVARKNLQAKEKELQEGLAENTTLACEISNLRSLQQQQTLSVQELQDEIQRLHDELNSQSNLLREAREKGPGAKEAMQKLRQKEDERDEMEQELEESEATKKRALADAKSRAIEAEELRRANETLREDARRREEELRLSNEALERQSGLARLRIGEGGSGSRSSSWSPPRDRRDARDEVDPRDTRSMAPSSGMLDIQTVFKDSGYPESSRSTRRPGDLVYERNRDSYDTMCEIITAQDSQLDVTTAPSRGLPAQRSPSPEEIRGRLEGQAGLLGALEEIQDVLNSRERDLQERKAGGLGDSRGSSSMSRSFPSDELGPHAGLVSDFGEAVDLPSISGRPASPPRTAPIAADVKLKDDEGRAAAVRGYPDSPTGGGTRGPEMYPSSPSRDDYAPDVPVTSGSASSGSKQAGQQGLPSVVREMFRRAEALSERQEFDDAVPCFQQVLQILEGGSPEVEDVLPVVVAEVWAHLGVAMQSLDRVREAIDSYKRAVTLDGSLHVCFANLATLHAYLNEHEIAREYIAKALDLSPHDKTYNEIRRRMEDGTAQHDSGKASADADA